MVGGGQPRRNTSTASSLAKAAESSISKDDDLLTDALIGHKGRGGPSGNGANGGDQIRDLHLKDHQTGYDVKIGDGMDIAIHGENGKLPFSSSKMLI